MSGQGNSYTPSGPATRVSEACFNVSLVAAISLREPSMAKSNGVVFKLPTDNVGVPSKDIDLLAATHPILASILAGREKGHPAGAMPTTSVLIFLDGGRIKFCLHPVESQKVAFGCITDPSDLLTSFEAEVTAGNYEWRKSRSR